MTTERFIKRFSKSLPDLNLEYNLKRNLDVNQNLDVIECQNEVEKKYLNKYLCINNKEDQLINMEKIYKSSTNDYLKKLFPFKKNVCYEDLRITKVGRYSISHRFDSNFLSKTIKNLYKYIKLNPKNVVVTDATAGVGGNTLSFGLFFGKVNAIEIEDVQFNALRHNVEQFNLPNVEFFKGSCLDIVPQLQQDVIFIDPPWGGKDYKLKNQLNLYLDNKEVVEITNDWINKSEFIFIKIPKNFTLESFLDKSIFPYIYSFCLRKYDILLLSKRMCKIFKYNKLK